MSDTKPDLDAIEARAKTAHDEVSRLCCGNDRGWRMSIPANDARDSDLIISAALYDLEALVAYARTLEAENERLRAALVSPDEWDAALMGHVGRSQRLLARAKAAEAECDRLAQRLDQVRALRDQIAKERLRSGTSTTYELGYHDGAADERSAMVRALDRVLDGDQRTETP